MPNMVMDTREVNAVPDIFNSLDRKIELETAAMDAGDYWCPATGIGIERKTINDFWQSLNSKRLWEQLEKITQAYEKPILLIEHIWVESTPWDDVEPAILSVLYSWKKVKIYQTSSREGTIAYLLRTATYSGPSGHVPAPRVIRKEMTVPEIKKAMLRCIMGMGEKGSGRILERYPGFEELMAAEFGELMRVPKVSHDAKKRLFEVLHGEQPQS